MFSVECLNRQFSGEKYILQPPVNIVIEVLWHHPYYFFILLVVINTSCKVVSVSSVRVQSGLWCHLTKWRECCLQQPGDEGAVLGELVG